MRLTWTVALMLVALMLLVVPIPDAVVVYAPLLALLGCAHLARRFRQGGLRLELEMSSGLVRAGQAVTLRLTLRNERRLPLPWIWVTQPLPVQLEAPSPNWCLALPPRQSVSVDCRLAPVRRGRYDLGQTRLELGDWFGLYGDHQLARTDTILTVFPGPWAAQRETLRALVPQGPRPQGNSPFTDDLAAGVRPYAPGDPLRQIAWKASARTGALVVNHFPRVRERATTIVLDLAPGAWTTVRALRAMEDAIAFIGGYLWDPPGGPHAVGFLTFGAAETFTATGTGVVREPARLIDIPPRTGLGHRRAILGVLAGIHPAGGPALPELILPRLTRLRPGETMLVITGGHDAQGWARVGAAALRHHCPITVIACEGREAPVCPGLRVLALPLARDGR